MRLLFSLLLIIGGICGIAVGGLNDVVVNSTLAAIDGLDVSMILVVFSIAILINGIYNLFSTN